MNDFLLKLGRISAGKFLLSLAFIAAGWLICGLWSNGIFSGDETRVAGISAEMVFRGDWLVPRLNGEPFLEYPPLFYQLQALSFCCFGINDVAAAIPSALAAYGGVIVLFLLARRLEFSGVKSFVCALLLLSSAQYLSNSRSCRVDMLLALAVLLAIYGFYAMLTEEKLAKKCCFWGLGTLGLGVGILTKGLIGAALPAAALGGFLLTRDLVNKKLALKDYLLLAAGGLVSLLPVGIYLGLILHFEGEEAFNTIVFTNNLGRFTGSQGDHVAPVYDYLLHLGEEFQPYLLLLLGGIWLLVRRFWRERSEKVLFMLSILFFPYLLLTLSSSKRMVYLLPLCAPCALIVGEFTLYLLDRWRESNYRNQQWAGFLVRNLFWVIALASLVGVWGGVPGMVMGSLAIGFSIGAGICQHRRQSAFGALLLLMSVGFLIGGIESRVCAYNWESESLKMMFEYCVELEQRTGAKLVLYTPSERTAGAANYYLKRNVQVRKDFASYDGKQPEIWILRNKRIQQGGKKFADFHRVYVLPGEVPPLP